MPSEFATGAIGITPSQVQGVLNFMCDLAVEAATKTESKWDDRALLVLRPILTSDSFAKFIANMFVDNDNDPVKVGVKFDEIVAAKKWAGEPNPHRS